MDLKVDVIHRTSEREFSLAGLEQLGEADGAHEGIREYQIIASGYINATTNVVVDLKLAGGRGGTVIPRELERPPA